MSELSDIIKHKLDQQQTQTVLRDIARDQDFTGNDVLSAQDTLARRLRDIGVQAGDLILLSLPNSAANITVQLTAFDLDVVVQTINPNMPTAELRTTMVQHHFAAMILNEVHARALPEIEATSDLHFVHETGTLLGSDFTLAAARNQQVGNPLLDQLNATGQSPLGVLMYTSGSSGHPKAVALNHAQLLAAASEIARTQQLTTADKTLLVMPLFHINAQVITVLATLVSGGSIAIAPKFSASHFWQQVRDNQITWVSAAPAIIAILLKTKPLSAPQVPHLRFIRSASAPLLPAVQTAFERDFGIPIQQAYGMTEGASQITFNPLGATKAGSVGKSGGTAISLQDENGRQLAQGATGEICLRGDHIITAYLDPSLQDDFDNGWFRSGDVGHLDADGYLFIDGRKKELINRGGDKISPVAIENVLITHPDVRNIAVFGMPDPVYGERVAAAVIPEADAPSATDLAQSLRAYATQRLARFEVPTDIYFTDSLPAGATGKIQRRRVRDQITTQHVAAN